MSSVLVCAGPVQAQTSDQVGVRALGMGGAFTAVADDSTATWWNPAGLASGAYISAIIEYAHPDTGPGEGLRGISASFPALGLSYYRLPSPASSSATTGTDGGSRQDEGSLSVFGATFGQSFGRHLVVGSTFKILHHDETKTGLDIGAMGAFGGLRLGLMVRNVTEPDFGDVVEEFTLERHARAGAAFTSGGHGFLESATVAVDIDLNESNRRFGELFGDERRLAVGGEIWTKGRQIGVRGGASRSTVGLERSAFSGGVSVAPRTGLFLDGYWVGAGTDEFRDGWGFAFRVTF